VEELAVLDLVAVEELLVREDVAMRVDDALGQAGRAARVVQLRRVIRPIPSRAQPGDALFFHCNLLHRSDQNSSPNPRWSLICCYNAARNDPYKESHHPGYTPLIKEDEGAILRVGTKISSADKVFVHPEDDKTVKGERAP
jgi:hypothetical protein